FTVLVRATQIPVAVQIKVETEICSPHFEPVVLRFIGIEIRNAHRLAEFFDSYRRKIFCLHYLTYAFRQERVFDIDGSLPGCLQMRYALLVVSIRFGIRYDQVVVQLKAVIYVEFDTSNAGLLRAFVAKGAGIECQIRQTRLRSARLGLGAAGAPCADDIARHRGTPTACIGQEGGSVERRT